MNDEIEGITCKGQPVSRDYFPSDKEYVDFTIDCAELFSGDAIKAPFEGPFIVDITPAEGKFELTVRNGENATHVTLPARGWKQRFIDRAANVEESSRIIRKGTPKEIGEHNFKRGKHHDESARLLQKALKPEGIDISFETARNLFDVMAQLVKPVVVDKGPGPETLEKK